MAININVSPTAGSACMETPASLTFQDSDGLNYGRSPKDQKFLIKTFEDYERTTTLGIDKTVWVRHAASQWRILKINVKNSQPTVSDCQSITKVVPISGSGTSSKTVEQLDSNNQYWVYGISNGATIKLSGVNSSNTVISDFKYSNASAWTAGTITGSDPNRTMTLPSGFGTSDVYYFCFKVKVESLSSGSSINVFAESTSASEATYVVNTTQENTVSWSVASVVLPAVVGGEGSAVTCTNDTNESCTLTYSNQGYSVSPSRVTSVAGKSSVELTLSPSTSNYTTYNSFLASETSSSKNLGSISAKKNSTTLATCTISQAAGTINSKTLSVGGGNVTISKMSSASSASATVEFVSKAYNGTNTSVDAGVDVWVVASQVPTGLTVSVDNTAKTITFTATSSFESGNVQFTQQLYPNGTPTAWAAGLTTSVAVSVIEQAKPIINVVSSQGGGGTYNVTGEYQNYIGDYYINLECNPGWDSNIVSEATTAAQNGKLGAHVTDAYTAGGVDIYAGVTSGATATIERVEGQYVLKILNVRTTQSPGGLDVDVCLTWKDTSYSQYFDVGSAHGKLISQS